LINNKKTNIVITGANGFIGKNLLLALKENHYFNVHKIVKNSKNDYVKKVLKESEFIFHLAGENRPKNKSSFRKNNEEFTKKICNILFKNNIKSTLVFASSIQVNLKNSYGQSKKNTEKIILQHKKKNKSKVCILRLTNIFGKLSKPNYNSFVATICYSVANNKKYFIEKNKLNLIYIDDLINKFIRLLKYQNIKTYEKIAPVYKVNTLKVQYLINRFNLMENNYFVDDLGYGFVKKLYSTFLSFLPKNRWSYKVKAFEDPRGKFIEFIKTKKSGQISVFSINVGNSRGEHYHHTKTEKFLIIQGKVKIYFRNIVTNQKYSIYINSNGNKVFNTIPGWVHSIKNVGNNRVIGIVWANEFFNIKRPDTISVKI
jgi:UDP-2-acetamido-2,6-beta-L-arabino-hexul-4-ose reductase